MRRQLIKQVIFQLISFLFFIILASKSFANELNDTRPAELAGANKKLNETYQKILQKLGSIEQAKLRKAERVWILLRDLDCEWVQGNLYECLMERTDNREQELRQTYFYDKNKNYLSISSEK